MKTLPILCLICFATFFGESASAQQSFRLSSKFYEARFSAGQTLWSGQHRFGNVFCLQFPRATNAEALAEAMYNNNTLYYSRVAYSNLTAIYVVTSTVPSGRSVEAELESLADQNLKSVEAYPGIFSQHRSAGALGPSLTLIVRNAKEGSQESPFPFIRTINPQLNAPLTSISVHRLFVHLPDRIELAGLRMFNEPIAADQETTAVSELEALVEQAAKSLQECTASMPPRVPQ